MFDTTPTVSPLKRDKMATSDRELSEGALSDVSDDEETDILEDGELRSSPVKMMTDSSNYDSDLYSRGSTHDEDEHLLITESPASPDTIQMVTGSPIKMIPASPQRSERPDNGLGGWVNVFSPDKEATTDEDEDVDEDILYLRLMALRSLAVEEDQGKTVNEMESEMEQLLEEAEEAAKMDSENEVITIDDEEDDTITEMKLNLHESFIKFNQSVEIINLDDDSPLYSPSQSVSPVWITPPVSPKQTRSIPFPHGLTCPPPLPLSPPPIRPPCPPPPSLALFRPPPPPPIYPDPVPTTEPLPPGVDFPLSPSPFLHKHEEMELHNSEDEVTPEDRFFQCQVKDRRSEIQFPPSVWDFSASSSELTQKGNGENSRICNNKENNQSVSVDEDEETLRALLLSQMSGGIGKSSKKSNKLPEPVKKMNKSEPVENKKKSNDIITDAKKIDNEKSEVDDISLSYNTVIANDVQHKELVEGDISKPMPHTTSKNKFKKSSSSKAIRKIKTISKYKSIKLLKKLSKKMSKKEQEIHFPNLVKRVVIPLGEDSEEEVDMFANDTCSDPGLNIRQSDKHSSLFGMNLEAFLREARKTNLPNSSNKSKVKRLESKTANRASKINKRSMSKLLTTQSRAHTRKLSLADKKRLIDEKISILDQSKQKEYLRLKQLIKKKMSSNMTAKIALVKDSLAQEKNKNTPKDIEVQCDETVKVLSNVNELSSSLIANDDELKLRLQLLENMINRNEASNKQNIRDNDKQYVGSSVQDGKSPLKSSSPNLTVGSSGDTKYVEIGEKGNFEEYKDVVKIKNVVENYSEDNKDVAEKTENKTDQKLELSNVEKDVVGLRKIVSTSLFKLSAYMSQLQKETGGVESGLNYVEELRRQLKHTEQLVTARQAKVDNLRDVIRDSHQQIIKERREMTDKETECETQGRLLVGADYHPPTEGADNIRRKLDQIKSTAMKVKTSGSTGKSNDRLGSGEIDYSSPLAHMTVSTTVQLDPHTQLCRFQLAGRCNDQHCTFQHCDK